MNASKSRMNEDEQLALILQEQYDSEINGGEIDINDEISKYLPTYAELEKSFRESPTKNNINKNSAPSIVAPEWEDLDPTPDLHAMFVQYNKQFFWGRLSGCEVKWSPRMTVCAGVCSYQGYGGLCSIRLSVPLLKLRPRKDFVETLLHEMIHAYLFVTDGNDNHDGHGPAFHEHMYRINKAAGTKISVYHTFHDEVALYKTHWWKCNGPCQYKKPYYGMVKRSMNRAPGKNDNWWAQHEMTCGGTYVKVKEPENFGKKTSTSKRTGPKELQKGQKDIRSFIPSTSSNSGGRGSKENIENMGNVSKRKDLGESSKAAGKGGGVRGNMFGFGGTSFGSPGTGSSGGLKTKGKSGTQVVKPGWKTKDNSSSGSVISANATSTITSQALSSNSNNVSSDTVRDQVRNFWSNKFNPNCDDLKRKKENEEKLVKPKVFKVDDDEDDCQSLGKCPVCSKHIPLNQINKHIDDCLNNTQNQATKLSSECKKTKKPNPFVEPEENGKFPCPICQREVYADDMNIHLDNCINKE